MADAGIIAILATLDTKGLEADYLVQALARQGMKTKVLDLGVVGPPQTVPDISSEAVAEAALTSVNELRLAPRDVAMNRMGEGAGVMLKQLRDKGSLIGAVGIGGNQGTAMACTAMQNLPLGLPKLMVSTVTSGDIRPFIGAKDITMFFAVADLLGGPNPVTKHVLSQAAGAIAGMVRWGEPLELRGEPTAVAITALGNTHDAVSRCLERLKGAGYRTIPFHASGACGSAMEELIELGHFAAVLDITPHELVGDVLGYDIYRPVRPGRLSAAARAGIPQVVCPGGLDYYCFGPQESIPSHLQDRTAYMHNRLNANVMLSEEEFARLASELAARLNQSTGPVTFVLPGRGWSKYGRVDGPLWNRAGHAAFAAELKRRLLSKVKLLELDTHINDPLVADTCVEEIKAMLGHTQKNASVR